MDEIEIKKIIENIRNNYKFKDAGCLFKNASTEDLLILDELEEFINNYSGIKIPLELRNFYDKYNPYCIPSIAGTNLLNLQQIKKENIYNEPGKYLLKKGYLIIGLTFQGVIICVNLNNPQLNVLIGYFDFCRYNQNTGEVDIVYYPKSILKDNKDTVLQFTKENIENSLVEIAPSFGMFFNDILNYKILCTYIKDENFVFKEDDDDNIIRYKTGVYIYDNNRVMLELNLERNMSYLENSLNSASEESPKKLLLKLDNVLMKKSDYEEQHFEIQKFEINNDFIKIIHYDFDYNPNTIIEDYTLKVSTIKFKELLDFLISKRTEIEESDTPWNYIN